MARTISCPVRFPNVIGLMLPSRPGKTGFRFSFARNFDASFTAFQVVPNHGFRSASVNPYHMAGQIAPNQVGFIFNISDYTPVHATLIDGVPLYFKVEAQNPNGTFDAPEAMHLVLPANLPSGGSFSLVGTVPQGAVAFTNSLEIQLPIRTFDWQINVTSGTNLGVAFDSGGPEMTVTFDPVENNNPFRQPFTNITQLFLRGIGGTSGISCLFTLNNNPFY